MTKEQICILIAMAVYMIAVVVIGVICARRNRTADDFYLGGRKLGPLVTAMSAEASDMSSWLLMGLPGLAYLTGISDAGWTAIGLAVGTYVNWLVVSKRLRRYTVVAKNSITLPDFFSNRYGDMRVRAGDPGLLCSLYGFRLRCLRQAVQQPVRRALCGSDGGQRRGYRGLYGYRRLPGRQHH